MIEYLNALCQSYPWLIYAMTILLFTTLAFTSVVNGWLKWKTSAIIFSIQCVVMLGYISVATSQWWLNLGSPLP